jgi:large subunit ribosomal protein L17
MRHRLQGRKLGRTSAHRKALLGSLVCNLIEQKRITTTLPKAKSASALADKMITLGKKGTVAARRHAVSILRRSTHVKVLFDEIAPQCTERNGGYTRIVRLGRRVGDGAEMAFLEWTDVAPVEKKKKKKKESEKDDDQDKK